MRERVAQRGTANKSQLRILCHLAHTNSALTQGKRKGPPGPFPNRRLLPLAAVRLPTDTLDGDALCSHDLVL